MGFLSGTKKVSGYIFNFRVSQWIDYDNLKGNANYLIELFKSLYRIKPVEYVENFEDAVERLDMTPLDIAEQIKRYSLLTYMYLLLAATFCLYSIYVGITGNFMGACMSAALSLYAVSLAFRYHFWCFQLKRQKLGCTVQEWLQNFFHKDRKEIM